MTNDKPPLIGSWTVTIHEVRPFTIHGDLYYELHITRPDDPTNRLMALRVPQHACPTPPAANQTVILTFLMGQVTAAKPADPV